MADEPAEATEPTVQEQLIGQLDYIVATTIPSLVRKEELGVSYDFSPAIPAFERLISLFSALREVDFAALPNVPDEVLTGFLAAAKSVLGQFTQITQFDAMAPTAAQTRQDLIAAIEQAYLPHFNAITPFLAYATAQGTNFETLTVDAKRSADAIGEMLTAANKQAEGLGEQATEILTKIRGVAAETGVAEHQLLFEGEAQTHKDASKKWLWATIVLGALTAVFVIVSALYFELDTEAKTAQIVQYVTVRLLGFSVFSFGTVWAAGIYKAHRHNFTVNRHRRNALGTFQAFVSAASADQDTKNAVLLKSTEAIFSPVSTGYAGGASDANKGGVQMIEMIRGNVPKKD